VNPFEDVIIELDAALTGNSSGVSAVSAVRDAAAPGRLKRGDHLVLSDYKTRVFFNPVGLLCLATDAPAEVWAVWNGPDAYWARARFEREMREHFANAVASA
jgi:hypothetical protein